MAFFGDQEVDELRIERMILHVIGHDHEFEPQPEVEGFEHRNFFLARIHDAASSAVHEFSPGSPTKQLIAEMASGARNFVAGGQELARRFSKDHRGSSSDGAFFVIELRVDDPKTVFYCMIKYDYRAAVELSHQDGKNVLRQIVQAFVRDRRAVQKCCIVRAKNGVVEASVSAVDRMGKAPDLTGYFESFLDVRRNRDNDELSQNLSEALRRIIVGCKEHVADLNVGQAVGHVKDLLHQRNQVDEEAVREAVNVAVGRPDDEAIVGKIDKKIAQVLRGSNLEGVTFQPNASFFRSRPRRKVATQEGVMLDYPGELENQSVQRQRLPEGGWQFTIRTNQELSVDETVPSKPRRAN